MGFLAEMIYILLFLALYFEVFLLVSFISKIRHVHTPINEKSLPTATIIVPCFNEERGIANTLKSLQQLDYPTDMLKIYVVDDGSTDNTLAIAHAFEDDSRIKIFSKQNGGKYTAMNFALDHIDTELVGCLDADSTVDTNALRIIAPVFADDEVGAVTPGIHVKEPHTWLQRMQYAEYRVSMFIRFMLAHLGSAFITPGPFSIFRASLVKKLGGWHHAHSTEDMEMALRIQEAGYSIANVPDAIVETVTPDELQPLIKQRTRWAYGGIKNIIDFRHMLGNSRYGNLGLFVLPLSAISIFTCIFLYTRMWSAIAQSVYDNIERIQIVGFSYPTLDPFYIDTSAILFLIVVAVLLVVIVVGAGSWLGTGKKSLPRGTFLFLTAYSFIAPIWLFTSIFRVIFNTGVKWR